MAAGDSVIALPYVQDPQARKRQETRSPWPGVKLTMDRPEEPSRPNAVGSTVRAPIIGYEVVEQREKFTVYKIQVHSNGKSWFVFRRYTDFDRLNAKLQEVFPNFRIKLPGRRWFKNNFDGDFLRERAHGLQYYVNNLMNHPDIWQRLHDTNINKYFLLEIYSPEVKQFFCLDDPPGPYDSLEESRAYCQHLEEELTCAKQRIQELTGELGVTKSQLTQARVQQEALVSALRAERRMHKDSAGVTSDVKELLMAGEASWKDYGPSLTGKTARLMQLTNSQEVKESWRGRMDFTTQSSGLERRRPSRGKRSSSDVANPRTSTPKAAGDESEEPAATSVVHLSNDSSVCLAEAGGITPRESTSKRDSGILDDHNESPSSSS